MIAELPERTHHQPLSRRRPRGFLFERDDIMFKSLHLKRRFALCLTLVALLGICLAPRNVAYAAGFPVWDAGTVQPQVNWNSGTTN